MAAPPDPTSPLDMDYSSERGLRGAGFLAYLAVALMPLHGLVTGEISLRWPTPIGLAAFAIVPLLFYGGQRCPRTEPPSLLLQAFTLLQLPAALLASWALPYHTMQILLVVAAAQLPRCYSLPVTVLVMAATDAGLAVVLAGKARSATELVTDLIGYVSFQGFAILVTTYAVHAQSIGNELLRINAELMATRRLLAESARSEERLRLSRELHDVVGHKLTALKLQLRLLERDAPSAHKGAVGDCMRLSDELLSDVRGVVSTLRSDEGIDLHAALSALIPAVPRPQVRLDLDADTRVPGVEQAQALLRCAQEGITNVLRHSDAGQVTVGLRRADRGVTLSIEDDGSAQSPPAWGNGLNGMRERLQALGGALEVAVNGRHGLRVSAWLPLPPAPPA